MGTFKDVFKSMFVLIRLKKDLKDTYDDYDIPIIQHAMTMVKPVILHNAMQLRNVCFGFVNTFNLFEKNYQNFEKKQKKLKK